MSAVKNENRLINETSPYLLQHARNPVDWHPWGDAAFELARERDVPVLLSIGYSSCHWCHVMERETFEDEGAAELLNRLFVCVKVDREERPDVDHFYMQACQYITGGGGWPLTSFLHWNRKPFFAGTYFTRAALTSLAERVDLLWRTRRNELLSSAESIAAQTEERFTDGHEGALPPDAAAAAAARILTAFDARNGGFGGAPKFPSPHKLLFLMRAARDEPADGEIWRAVSKTLAHMARGGLRDHLGGGFCRYSTDEKWLLPHFEKMLYDNALLMLAYTEHFQKTNDADDAELVRETAEYVAREMTDVETGLFFTAQDADSDGIEGKFYTFTPEEVRAELGSGAPRFCGAFDITPGGHIDGRSVPNMLKNPSIPLFDPELSEPRSRMFRYRAKRNPPMRDEKALLTSSSLMAAALAKAAAVFSNEDYRKAAARAAQFMLRHMRDLEDNRLYAVYKDGIAGKAATLDGYAYLIWSLIELYEADYGAAWLDEAEGLTESALKLFGGESGGLYYTGADMSDLPRRGINAYDNAAPSGQSVMAHNLLRLSRLLERGEWEARAKNLIGSLAEDAAYSPGAYTFLLAAHDYLQDGGIDVKITGEGADELLGALRGYSPYMTVRFTAGEGGAKAYICAGKTCHAPVTTAEQVRRVLMNN